MDEAVDLKLDIQAAPVSLSHSCLFFPWVVAQGEHTLTRCVLSKVRLTAAGAHLKHTLIELPSKHIARLVGCTD